MTTLSNDFIFAWKGAIADIPANTSRYTAWDGKYFKVAGTGVDGGGTGGTATHLHSCSCPAHIYPATHLHTFSGASPNPNYGNPLGSSRVASGTHTHASTNSNNATTTMSTKTFNCATRPNEPPYSEVIFIQSDGTLTGVPNDAIAFFNNATPPASWTKIVEGKMLKGAVAASEVGDDGGFTGHSHWLTHSHAVVQHGHSAKNSAANTGSSLVAGVNLCSADKEVHSVTLANQLAGNVGDCSAFLSSSDNDEPLWRKLAIIQNDTGGLSLPDQIILIYKGTHASIPASFARLTDEDDYFVKGIAGGGDAVGDTGGSTVHNHTDDAMDHVHAYTHNHTGSGAGGASTYGSGPPGPNAAATGLHSMTWTVGNATQTSDEETVTISDCSSKANYPPYAEGILVQYTAPAIGGVATTQGCIIG